MTRDKIYVQYPTLDHTESVANIGIEKKTVVAANGITLVDAFSNKNNSLFVIVENDDDTKSSMTVKSGNAYPNSMLGDISIEIPVGVSAIQVQDLARFEKSDGSVDLDFAEGFDGSVYAIAKWAGVRPVVE